MLQVVRIASTSKGVTVTNSTATYSTTGVIFNQCQFTKFARLVDISYDATNIRFHDCDFSTAYYGALIGAEMDGSTAGLTTDRETCTSQALVGVT